MSRNARNLARRVVREARPLATRLRSRPHAPRGAESRPRHAWRYRRRRDTGRDSTRDGSAAREATSVPTAESVPRGRRVRPGARRVPPCGGRHSSSSTPWPCTRTGPAGRARSRRTENARTRRPDTRSAGTRGTPPRRTAGALLRPASRPRTRGRSRSDRGPPDTPRSGRVSVAGTGSSAGPRRVSRTSGTNERNSRDAHDQWPRRSEHEVCADLRPSSVAES
jgi:hypothetical protein